MSASPARLRVNPIACTGHGLCAELLPERITLDEWGYPVVSAEPVPPALEHLARRAVTDCPALALMIERAGPDAPALHRSSGRGPHAGSR